jgi:hypothetical protein
MITMASTIFTILSVIGTVVINQVSTYPLFLNQYQYILHPLFSIFSIALIVGIILALISIIYFVKSYAIRIYSYPIGVEYFFKKDDLTQEEKIDKSEMLPRRDLLNI